MANSAIIGGEVENGVKSCPRCGAGFAGEALSFFLLTRGNTKRCSACHKDCYLRPDRNLAYAVAFVVGAAAGALAVLLINAFVALATLQPDGSFLIFWWVVLLSIVAGFWAWRAVLRVYNYHTGRFSDDDLHQSIMDFGG